jgi:RNA polymerase sigma-70 factor, ECF subfamily
MDEAGAIRIVPKDAVVSLESQCVHRRRPLGAGGELVREIGRRDLMGDGDVQAPAAAGKEIEDKPPEILREHVMEPVDDRFAGLAGEHSVDERRPAMRHRVTDNPVLVGQWSGVHGNVRRETPVLYMIHSRPDESGERLEDAFGQLLESVRPELVRFAYWLARDRSVAEDVVQEAMLRAWRARSELKDAAAARHWLLTIVRREHARLYERKRLITVDVSEVVAREDIALGRAGDGDMLDLRRAILRLPDDYREPLVMQVLGGYSTAEIAKEMNL